MEKTKIIGRVVATEKNPTTIDEFTFWTNTDSMLSAFDIVKVEHINNSYSYGVVKNISHITDANSYLAGFISSDFGDTEIEMPTLRVGMNYVEVVISYNDKNIYTPVLNGAPVFLATADEITAALGLDKVRNKLVCGSLKMYEGTGNEISLPVSLNSKFLIGPEGAHLNISGISGLASKTSYAMFLIKSMQHTFMKENEKNKESEKIAFVIFNLKGKDLMALHEANDLSEEPSEERNHIYEEYNAMGIPFEPLKHVQYLIPYYKPNEKSSTYLSKELEQEYIANNQLRKFKYVYEDDKESLEMLFANIDDPQQTMEAIISKIVDDNDKDFKGIRTWEDFRQKIDQLSQKSSELGKTSNEISVLSWRKFKRIINKTLKDDGLFAQRVVDDNRDECRLAEELKRIKANDIKVIDIAKLPEDKQAFVFGDSLKSLYNLKLGEYDEELPSGEIPDRIVIFVDELNKYVSKDSPKNSPILRQILDITERGRSLGVVLFGAEQFRSNIHSRVTGNCATHAYGRTNTIETSTKDYSSFPTTYKNILIRLEQGEYLIQNPMFRALLKVKFPKPVYKQFKK